MKEQTYGGDIHLKEQTYGENTRWSVHRVECVHGGGIHIVGARRGYTHDGINM